MKSKLEMLPLQLNPDPEEIVRCKAEILEKIAEGHNFSKEHFWYLALPVRIDEQRLSAIFSEEAEARKLFQMAELAGLFTGCGKTSGFWFLHEEIRDVLLWWAGENNKLESNETRGRYHKLLRVMKNQHPEWIDVSGFVRLNAGEIERLKLEHSKDGVFSSDARAWYAEGICYGIMRSENLSKLKLNSTVFMDQLMSSAYFTLYAKWNLANNIEKMSEGSVRAIEYLLRVEKDELVEIIGEENYEILRAASLSCDLIGVSDTAWWLKKIQEQPDNLGWYGGLFKFYDLNTSFEEITHEQLITWGKHLGYVYESDLECQDKVIAARALRTLGALLNKLGQKEEGVKVYGYLTSKSMDDTDTAIKKEVANALYNKGVFLGEMGRREEAIEVYENMASKYDSVVDAKIQRFVAVALYNKGVYLGEMDRREEAVVAFESMASKYSCYDEVEIRKYVAAALLNKGVLLSKMQRVDKAIEMFDEVVTRFGDTGNMSIQEQVVRALLNKGMQLYQMEQKEESIAVYDELLIRCNGVVEPAILEMVVESFMRKAMALEELDRRVESIAVYDEFIERFSSAKAITMQELVVTALGRKAIQLGEIGRRKESVDVCVEVVERIKEDNNPVFRRPLAEALFYKGFNLSEMGLGRDAIVVYDELVERFGNDVEIAIQVQVAKALFHKGVMLSMIGKRNEAIVVFEETITKFGDTRHLLICELVVQSLFNKGVMLTQLRRLDESITVYDEVVKKYGDYVESVICEWIVRSLYNKGIILSMLQRGDEFMDVYDDLYNRFGENTEPAIREWVTSGLEIKSHALLMIAKQCWGSKTEMQTWLAEAAVIFKKIHDRCKGNDFAKNTAKQAYTAHLLNEPESYVRELMREALRLGGLNVYQAMLSDLAQIPIPPDSKMRYLLDDEWRGVTVARQ